MKSRATLKSKLLRSFGNEGQESRFAYTASANRLSRALQRRIQPRLAYGALILLTLIVLNQVAASVAAYVRVLGW